MHLIGVLCSAIAGRAEVAGYSVESQLFIPVLLIAAATYFLCPLWALMVLLSGRPLHREHVWLLVVVILLECAQTFVMLPMVQ